MTDPELECFRKQIGAVRVMGFSHYNIVLDLEKWNLKFRPTLCSSIGELLDKLFGIPNLWENGHLWFVHAWVFANSRLCPPDFVYAADEFGNIIPIPIPGKYFHKNHKGGFGGMMQKFWTSITINIIRLAMHRCGIKGTIISQGDNVVIIVKTTEQDNKKIKEMLDGFIAQLETEFRRAYFKTSRDLVFSLAF